LELTPDQLSAARACGCSFSPATDDQIRRFSAQRRIFRIDGAPFVAARGGGFVETWATLAALIERHRRAAAEQDAAAETAPGPEHDAQSRAEPPPAPAETDAARAEQDRRGASAATPRRPKAAKRQPARAEGGAAPASEAAARPSEAEAEEMLAGVAAAQGGGPRARVPGRWRAGEPPTPRWMVAGKMRRGRLK
jgi:hypothetical protein